VGRFVTRGKEHVCVIQAYQKGLLLTTLHFSDEIYNIGEVLEDLPAPSEDEIRLASTLVNKLSGRFNLDEYMDNYRSMVEGLALQKDKGKEIIAEVIPKPTAPTDLMKELRRSIGVVTH
jgi:DNA end-binding protein Ku